MENTIFIFLYTDAFETHHLRSQIYGDGLDTHECIKAPSNGDNNLIYDVITGKTHTLPCTVVQLALVWKEL